MSVHFRAAGTPSTQIDATLNDNEGNNSNAWKMTFLTKASIDDQLPCTTFVVRMMLTKSNTIPTFMLQTLPFLRQLSKNVFFVTLDTASCNTGRNH